MDRIRFQEGELPRNPGGGTYVPNGLTRDGVEVDSQGVYWCRARLWRPDVQVRLVQYHERRGTRSWIDGSPLILWVAESVRDGRRIVVTADLLATRPIEEQLAVPRYGEEIPGSLVRDGRAGTAPST